jgi:hypothetical protein
MFLLFTLSIFKKPDRSSFKVETDSSFPKSRAGVALETAVVGGLVIGLTINMLFRLTRKLGWINVSQTSLERLSDTSEDEDPDCPSEYGLRDVILVVNDLEQMTDLPLHRDDSDHFENDDSDEVSLDAEYD